MSALLARLRRAREADPRLFRVRAGLALVLCGLALHLLFGKNPWEDGIAERLREGLPVRGIDYARTWLWWTAAGNLVLVAGLLATARRWLGPRRPPACEGLAPPARGGPAFALGVAGAVVACAVLAWPRLSHSWWDDEAYTVRKHIDGEYRRDGDGPPRFHHVGWREAFWRDREANNHIPFTLLSRLSLAGWRAATHPAAAFADERAVRLPAYLAGLGAVAVTALFCRRLGFAAAGVFAAWLLALHPWFLRYTSEARGYALLLLGVPATWLLLARALARGSWGRWLAYGAAQSLLLWTNVSMVYPLVFTNLAAVGAIALLTRDAAARREQAIRFAVTTLASAAVWAQLMLPNLIQIVDYLGSWEGLAGVPPLDDVLSHVLLGVEFRTRDPDYVTLSRVAAEMPRLLQAVAGVGVVAAALGFARWVLAGGLAALLAPALLLPGPLFFAVSWLRGDRFYPWYEVFALTGLAILIGSGLGAPFARLPRRLGAPLAGAALAAWLAAFAVLSQPSRHAMRAVSVVPTRESVQVTRPVRDPLDPANARILTASFSQPPFYYDPLVIWIETPADLERLMDEADRRGLTLFVNNGRPHAALDDHPELAALVRRDDLFEEVAVFHGLEKRGKRIVYRYRGRPR